MNVLKTIITTKCLGAKNVIFCRCSLVVMIAHQKNLVRFLCISGFGDLGGVWGNFLATLAERVACLFCYKLLLKPHFSKMEKSVVMAL